MIVILCGPVGVGKTTVSEILKSILDENGLDFNVLHSDDFSTHTYDQMFEEVKESDENWILDGTFYREDIRDKFRRLDDVIIVWLKAELDTCLKRNEQREEPLEEKVVHIMYQRFEEPDPDLKIETDDMDSEKVVDHIIEKWEDIK
ncbi:MAG: AAA family ATPase [Thermoplasmatota archaeon]